MKSLNVINKIINIIKNIKCKISYGKKIKDHMIVNKEEE